MDTQTNNLAFFDSKGLAGELQNFIADIQGLVAGATTMSAEELNEAKAKLNERMITLKNSFDELRGNIVYKVRKSATMTNNYVHDQPWKAIGVSTLAGFVVGYVFTRRC